MKILIVDDQKDIVKMVRRRLKKDGYELHDADNGKVALEKAVELKPDLILMDMHMPVMDGYDSVRAMRENGHEGLIVAHTASATVKDTEISLEAGCDYFLPKPIGKDFEEKIKHFIAVGRK